MNAPYNSTKHALAEAARLSSRLDFPARTSRPVVQNEPDAERERMPIAVRACMRNAGIDPDGEDAELLYRWATTADGTTELEHLAIANELPASHERREHIKAAAAAARLAQMIPTIGASLRESGMVPERSRLKVMSVAWRVVELEGTRTTQMVIEPSPQEEGLYRGPQGHEHALAVARGDADGPVHAAELAEFVNGVRPKQVALRNILRPRWEAREFEQLVDLDEAVARALKCSPQWARVVRASWGIAGTRGRRPTLPPGGTKSDGNS